MAKKMKYVGFAKHIHKLLVDPAFGFNGLLEHVANHADAWAKEAAEAGFGAADKDYRWLRDQLDSLAAKARSKGL